MKTIEKCKVAGSTIIVGAALLIMLPDLAKYLAGLWRLGILIAFVILLAWLLAVVVCKVCPGTADKKEKLAEENRPDSNEHTTGKE